MEGFEHKTIEGIQRASPVQIRQILRNETRDLEVTKSLINLLHNIVRVGSVPVTEAQRIYFDENSDIVLRLLNRKVSITWKKEALTKNLGLVRNIAASCPPVAGLS